MLRILKLLSIFSALKQYKPIFIALGGPAELDKPALLIHFSQTLMLNLQSNLSPFSNTLAIQSRISYKS